MDDLVADLEVIKPDAGSDGGADAGDLSAERGHLPQGLGENVSHGAAPAAVHRADDAVLSVVQQHGQAVGHEHRDRNAGLIRHKPVAQKARLALRLLKLCRNSGMHLGAVHLSGIDHSREIHAGRRGEAAEVFAHVAGRVAPADGEVQALERTGADAAEARGKGVARGDVRRGVEHHAVFRVPEPFGFVIRFFHSNPYTSWAGRWAAACRRGRDRCGRAF